MESVISKRIRALVLLETGFDAYLTIAIVKQLRELGIGVLIVGSSVGLVRDVNGICLWSEKSITDLRVKPDDLLLIIPGGKSYLLPLLTDPRIHRIFDTINNNEGFVLVANDTKQFIDEMEEKRPYSQSCFLFLETIAPQIITPEIINLLTNHSS